MKIDHISRAKKAWPLLVDRALAGGNSYTYGELCAEIGLHHRSAQWFLGVIQQHCKLNGLPALQALAVNKKTKLPGSGYIGSYRTADAHAAELRKVFKEKWSRKPPNFSQSS
ncbi:hypothetical protein [Paracidovorax avenae]|uniref:hypothetical protein n=1 Tax=Paracidovorax avenae TaxID=80867 RepID=UPI001AD8248E|nr:hypothetical protein [Paracidovorax avenae]